MKLYILAAALAACCGPALAQSTATPWHRTGDDSPIGTGYYETDISCYPSGPRHACSGWSPPWPKSINEFNDDCMLGFADGSAPVDIGADLDFGDQTMNPKRMQVTVAFDHPVHRLVTMSLDCDQTY